MFDDDSSHHTTVTTLDILDHLDPSINLSADIGRVGKSSVDPNISERLLQTQALLENDEDEGESGLRSNGVEGPVYDDDSDMEDGDAHTNGAGKDDAGDEPVKVEHDPGELRIELLRRHLFLLCESKHHLARHCGTPGEGQWTVDFDIVMQSLRQVEMDSLVQQVAGRRGLRLTRILREFGKLDEKTLADKALMKKPTLQEKMVQLQNVSFVDVQEVPRDNQNRVANRTMFFWYCDPDRMRSEMPDKVYKVMLRCLQVLEVERYKVRDILEFVHRTDVKGKEEEVMTPEYYNKYSQHLEVEAKLLGHAMRLDDIVAVLQDY